MLTTAALDQAERLLPVECGQRGVEQHARAVDRHVTLRCVEIGAENHRPQDVRFHRVRLLQRLGEHMHLKIGGFDTHVGRLIVAIAPLVAGDEG